MRSSAMGRLLFAEVSLFFIFFFSPGDMRPKYYHALNYVRYVTFDLLYRSGKKTKTLFPRS